jgi:flavorubredoxin
MITNPHTGTRIDEVADGIYRISTPLPPEVVPGGFSFNQYLLAGSEPIVFHTGPRKMFPVVREAIDHVLPASSIRYVAFSHVESDECGALNEFLAVAPDAVPLCGTIAAMVSVDDLADRAAAPMADGASLDAGERRVRWVDAPHLPHGWETGYLFDEATSTLLCGDLFTQPGNGEVPLTEADILGPSEAFRHALDYYSHTKNLRPLIGKLAALRPATLACMHGSAWRGDGASLLEELAARLDVQSSGS